MCEEGARVVEQGDSVTSASTALVLPGHQDLLPVAPKLEERSGRVCARVRKCPEEGQTGWGPEGKGLIGIKGARS